MGLLRRAVLALLGALLLCWAGIGGTPAGAQEEASPGELLSAIEQAPEFERGEERERLVEAAQEASTQRTAAIVQALIQQVENRGQTDDVNYIGHCVLALEELRAQEATDVLLDVLEDPSLPISYLAARALGTIYQGRGDSAEQAEQVNLALLAIAYSGAPQPLPYGAGIALSRVNGLTGAEPPQALGRAAMQRRLDEWLAAGNQLPPLSRMPWPVVLHVAVTGNPDPRRNALQILRQRRELEPVGRIIELLAEGELDAGAEEALGELLGELTGVPYPPNSASEEPTAEWREQWHRRLSGQSDARHVAYAWRQLELAVADYLADPSDRKSEIVAGLRTVLLDQLEDPGEIPPNATAQARKLLKPPLESKRTVSDAVAVLGAEDATDFDKSKAVQSIQTELRKDHGKEVVRLFLEPLAQTAAREQNRMFAADLASVLWQLTGIPLDLDEDSIETRQQRLLQWATTLESREGISIQLPI
ncbi:MAG: hypothetical protein R6V05_01980 [Candidatus Brocadiia bacterium]